MDRPAHGVEQVDDKFDDEHYPAYSMGRAAEMLATSQGFLRGLDELNLIDPQRSPGGHRRYSRYQLRLAARVRELVDHGTALDAACRIVTLQDQLAEAHRITPDAHPQPGPVTGDHAMTSGREPPTTGLIPDRG